VFRFSSDFLKSKTTWTGLATVVVTGYQLYKGAIDLNTAYVVIAGAFATVFHRDTVQKGIERESAERLKIVAAAQNAPAAVPIADAMAAHVALHTEGLKAALATTIGEVLAAFIAHPGVPAAVEPDGEADGDG
jgi:hypothetical protein